MVRLAFPRISTHAALIGYGDIRVGLSDTTLSGVLFADTSLIWGPRIFCQWQNKMSYLPCCDVRSTDFLTADPFLGCT